MSRVFFEASDDLSAEMSSIYSACMEQFSLCSIKRSQIDKYILDFFAEEGYYEPWTALAKDMQSASGEHAQSPPPPVIFLKERSEIRALIVNGKISETISRINDLNPQLLEKSPCVHFSLLQQKILETMNMFPEEDVLEQIEKELTPIVLESPELLSRLEETLIQYIFKNTADIAKKRRDLARYINHNILLSFRFQPRRELLNAIRESQELQETLPHNSPLNSFIAQRKADGASSEQLTPCANPVLDIPLAVNPAALPATNSH